ncbi:MAG TPA: hypothetical protein VN364_04770 [Bellilinea sp.]|nr:hypothetical protein [Bellilinea sp.]
MAFLTIFTTPKPFTNPHIATIQGNALANWQALGADVAVIVLGDESGAAEAATDYGALHLPEVARNAAGTPLISDLFEQARAHADGPLLAYVNADILLLPDFVDTARLALQKCKEFLLVGQRWDLDVTEPLAFDSGWEANLHQRVQQDGSLHPPAGSDYFIFPREAYREMPEFAIGRAGWDNWMIYQARRKGWPTIDATNSIFIVHQNHDYSHLPDGQPHYRLPETYENVRLAGGYRTIFTLADTNYKLVNGQIRNSDMPLKKILREIETFPQRRLNSTPLANLTYSIFHPIKAYRDFRGWLNKGKVR